MQQSEYYYQQFPHRRNITIVAPVRLTQEDYEEMSVCSGCGFPTEERFSGDEGWSVCENCGPVEGNTKYRFVNIDDWDDCITEEEFDKLPLK